MTEPNYHRCSAMERIIEVRDIAPWYIERREDGSWLLHIDASGEFLGAVRIPHCPWCGMELKA